jgi:hypothetical protein
VEIVCWWNGEVRVEKGIWVIHVAVGLVKSVSYEASRVLEKMWGAGGVLGERLLKTERETSMLVVGRIARVGLEWIPLPIAWALGKLSIPLSPDLAC